MNTQRLIPEWSRMVDVPPVNARNLTLDPKGFWIANRSDAMSYPEDGNEICSSIEDGSFWFRHRNRAIAAVMQQFPPNGTLFDIGGGNGFVAAGLEASGFPTVVVEPGRAGATNACNRGLKNVICATTDAAGFPLGSMDAIGLFDVVEHIENDVAFLESMHQLLRPGGRIYLTVPAFQTLWSSEDIFAGHFRRYTRRTLEKTLTSAGFTVEFSSYLFWFLPLPVFLLRSIPSRLGWRGNPTLQSATQDHTASGISGRVVEWALSRELARLAKGRSIPMGGSCLAVART